MHLSFDKVIINRNGERIMGRFGNVYEMILFDVDGVLLSEKRCFDTTLFIGMGAFIQSICFGNRWGRFSPDSR